MGEDRSRGSAKKAYPSKRSRHRNQTINSGIKADFSFILPLPGTTHTAVWSVQC